jgi:hypothetical protein
MMCPAASRFHGLVPYICHGLHARPVRPGIIDAQGFGKASCCKRGGVGCQCMPHVMKLLGISLSTSTAVWLGC